MFFCRHRRRVAKIVSRYILIHQRCKRESDQFPGRFSLGIDLRHHKVVGGFLPVQQQAVVTVGEHYAGTAEHLRCFAVEGDVRGWKAPLV